MNAAGPWRPMSEAPHDGTIVLLWVVDTPRAGKWRTNYWLTGQTTYDDNEVSAWAEINPPTEDEP